MKKNKFYFIVLAISFISLKCTKNTELTLTGKYVGTFSVTYSNSTMTGNATINFIDSGHYNSTGNPNHVPAGGSGTYSMSNNKIVFKDINFWTADFDWNLILTGQYDYTFDGKNLRIFADKNNVGHYEYNLTKQ
jgi:hypothetical protein